MPQSIYPLEHSPLINYSIIIPHYNTPDLLMRCLASIPVREDVQVIVVDDNSPEADTYLERYPELSRPYLEFVATNKGGGAGYARNVGIDKAKGKWLIFADADDFFVEDFSALLDDYRDIEADIIYFRAKGVNSDNIEESSGETCYDELFDAYFSTHDENGLRCRHYVPWAKFFLHSFISSFRLRFEETAYSNDIVFSVSAGCAASTIFVSNSVIYYWARRRFSLSNEFCTKPGELETRAIACYRSQKLIHAANIKLKGRMEISNFLVRLYHENKDLYASIFLHLPEVGCSRKTALRETRGWERGPLRKLALYLNAGYLLLSNCFRHYDSPDA